MQHVIEFGSDNLDPVIDCILAGVGLPTSIEVSSTDLGGPAYRRVNTGIESAANGLRMGALGSMVLRFQVPDVRYALVTAPHFLGQQLSAWMGTVEVTGPNWKDIWNLLLAKSDLRFVCVGMEEGIELTDEVLNPESFPWNAWPAVISALRCNDGTWVIKEN